MEQYLRLFDSRWLDPLVATLAGLAAGGLASLALRWTLGRLVRRTSSPLDDQMVQVLARALRLGGILLGLVLAVRLALPHPGEEALRRTVERLLWTIGLVALSAAAGRFVLLLLEALGRVPDRWKIVEPRTRPVFDIVAKVLLVFAAAWLFLKIWEVDATPWLASAGVLGIAVGFAAQDTLGNLFSGVFIIADAPYRVGDYIVLDNGTRGEVRQIGLRSTRILTRDDVEITIPNAVMAKAMIVNQSGGPHRKMRLRIAVGVAYGSDLDAVEEELLGLAREHAEVCEEPAPRVRFRRFGDSALEYELLCWIPDPALRGRVAHDLHRGIHRRFAERGIEIPYPQRDVHLHGGGAPA